MWDWPRWLERLGHAANAQSANPDGGRSASDIRTCGETRDPRERAEPQRAVAIAECGNHFASGQTVGDGEVLELAALGFESIDTARCADVQVSGPIVGQAPDRPAAQPVGHRVGGEAGAFGRRDRPSGTDRRLACRPTTGREDRREARSPAASLASSPIPMFVKRPSRCRARPRLDPSHTVPAPSSANAGPRTGHQLRVGLRILMKAAGRTLPANDAAVGPEMPHHPDVATGILERRGDAGGEAVRSRPYRWPSA